MSTDGAALTPQNAGYFDGVTDVYYALMTGMDARNQAPVYAAPVCAGKSIELQVTPNYREGKVYASDAATRREQRPDTYTVSMNLDQLIPSARSALLGRAAGSGGVELITGKNLGPWVAILFAATLDDNTREYYALYKGRFNEPTATHHTKNDGDSYQHPTITGTFVRLANDDRLMAMLSEAELMSPNRYGRYRRNLLKGTTGGAVDTPISSMTSYDSYGILYELSDYGRAVLLNGKGILYAPQLQIVYTGEGEAPSVECTITPVLLYEDGTSNQKMGVGYASGGQYNLSEIVGEWASETAKRIRAIAFRARSFSGCEDWALRLTGLGLYDGTATWPWSPAPEDWFERVVL